MKYPIPNDWDGLGWCRWAICWPDSPQWLALLRGFISLPQRGRTWDERTGNVRDVQLIGRDITANNLPTEGVIMSCGQAEELANAILYLADRLYNKPMCCDGTGGTGGGTANGGTQGVIEVGGETIVMVGSEPAGGLPVGGTMPEDGFEDQAAYDLYKCQVANQIIDGAVATLRNLAALSVGNVTGIAAVIGLAFAGIITLPVVAIPVLVSAMGLLFGVLIVLDQLSDDIQANRDDYVCELYNSNDTEGALGVVLALVSAALTSLGVATSLHPAVKVVITVIFSTDTLNQLWERLVAYSYPGADCSGCTDLTCEEEIGTGPFGWLAPGTATNLTDLGGGLWQVDLAGGAGRVDGYPQWAWGFEDESNCSFWIQSLSILSASGGWGVHYVRDDGSEYFGDNLAVLQDIGWLRRIRIWHDGTNSYRMTFYVDVRGSTEDPS